MNTPTFTTTLHQNMELTTETGALIAFVCIAITWLVFPFLQEQKSQEVREVGHRTALHDLRHGTSANPAANNRSPLDRGKQDPVDHADHGEEVVGGSVFKQNQDGVRGNSGSSTQSTLSTSSSASTRRKKPSSSRNRTASHGTDHYSHLDQHEEDPFLNLGPYFQSLDYFGWCCVLSFLDAKSLCNLELTAKAVKNLPGLFHEAVFETAWRVCYIQPYQSRNITLAALPKSVRDVAQNGLYTNGQDVILAEEAESSIVPVPARQSGPLLKQGSEDTYYIVEQQEDVEPAAVKLSPLGQLPDEATSADDDFVGTSSEPAIAKRNTGRRDESIPPGAPNMIHVVEQQDLRARRSRQLVFKKSFERRTTWKKRACQRVAALEHTKFDIHARLAHFHDWVTKIDIPKVTDIPVQQLLQQHKVVPYLSDATNLSFHIAARIREIQSVERLQTLMRKGSQSFGVDYQVPVQDNEGFLIGMTLVLVSAAVVFGLSGNSQPFVVCGRRTKRMTVAEIHDAQVQRNNQQFFARNNNPNLNQEDEVFGHTTFQAWHIPIVPANWHVLVEQVLKCTDAVESQSLSQLLFSPGLLYHVEHGLRAGGELQPNGVGAPRPGLMNPEEGRDRVDKYWVRECFPQRLNSCLQATGLKFDDIVRGSSMAEQTAGGVVGDASAGLVSEELGHSHQLKDGTKALGNKENQSVCDKTLALKFFMHFVHHDLEEHNLGQKITFER
ncbi:unnamed protein product [Amoebophrya sp. A120]|nr:unnamed protein product [Amoebophrya sp. A120]|eukprot:GSA120T00007827001.1